jgi:hypothetical protein
MNHITRRKFLTVAGAGLASVAASGTLQCALGNSSKNVGSWVDKKAINPSIDNLRVVCGYNPKMISADPVSWEIKDQAAALVTGEVERTLDAMAVSLAQTENVADAWKKIFRKPVSKEWNATKVAIKVNCITNSTPRVPVVNKICKELNTLGIPYENIIIYDGCSNATPIYASFVGNGLPAGVIVSDKNSALDGTVEIPVMIGNKIKKHSCSRSIAEGKIDILVNMAVNKGHDKNFGSTTLTLKNHAGTFAPKPLHFGGGMDYLLGFNRSDAILGGDPIRQQLCIVDSLWGALKGPFGYPDKRLDRLVMGTFSPSVDYLFAKKIREPLQNAKHENISRFLTHFGYQETDIGDLIMATV